MQDKYLKQRGRRSWSFWAAAAAVAGLSVFAAAVIARQGGRTGATGGLTPSVSQMSAAVVAERAGAARESSPGRMQAVETLADSPSPQPSQQAAAQRQPMRLWSR